MQFSIRPYFGHDCNSSEGFNNGYYLDKISVEATCESDAIEQAMRQYLLDHQINPKEIQIDGWFGENTLYWESKHTDSNGNETPDDFEGETFYTYQYIDFSQCELVKNKACK